MGTVFLQVAGACLFFVGTLVIGSRVRRNPTRESAESISRISHLMYWSCLVFPCLLGFFYPGLTRYDELLGIPSLPFRSGAWFVGVFFAVIGTVLLGVSNKCLIKMGSGTAAFLLTQRIVSESVYQRTRNPMSLGYYFACVGVGLLAGSTALTLGALLIIIPVHVFNLKYFEEVELDHRYGQTYRDYKQRVPFLMPSLARKNERRPETIQENQPS